MVNEGGAAFPHTAPDGWHDWGLSQRDYFACHVDQPGCSEIVATAGLKWDGYRVGSESDGEPLWQAFDVWWGSLPLKERYRLYASVRYAMADAMLEVRSE